MRKNRYSPEEVFYLNLVTLLNNLLINNKNYNNGYFANCTKQDVVKDTIDRAKYIIEEINRTKHLIKL